MQSLKALAIKSISSNYAELSDQLAEQPFIRKLINDYYDDHPDEPDTDLKLYMSYTSLNAKKVRCNYKGPMKTPEYMVHNFLQDPDNLTTKFINDKLNKYVNVDKIEFTEQQFRFIFTTYPIYVPKSVTFELNSKFTGSEASKVSITIYASNIMYNKNTNEATHIPTMHSANYNHGLYYTPLVIIDDTYNGYTTPEYKHHPKFVFNNKLQFVDDCVGNQPLNAEHLQPVLHRIIAFRKSVHAAHMSELHYWLLSCDVKYRIWNIMNLYPSIRYCELQKYAPLD